MLIKLLIHFSNHWKHWLFPASSAGSNPSSPANIQSLANIEFARLFLYLQRFAGFWLYKNLE